MGKRAAIEVEPWPGTQYTRLLCSDTIRTSHARARHPPALKRRLQAPAIHCERRRPMYCGMWRVWRVTLARVRPGGPPATTSTDAMLGTRCVGAGGAHLHGEGQCGSRRHADQRGCRIRQRARRARGSSLSALCAVPGRRVALRHGAGVGALPQLSPRRTHSHRLRTGPTASAQPRSARSD
jgi:hypothetical protein